MTLALKKTRAFQVYLRRTIQNQDQTRPTYDSSAYYVRQCRLQLESREWEQRERYANSCIFGRYCQPRLLPGFHIWAVTFFFFFAVLGLCCWALAFSSCRGRSYSSLQWAGFSLQWLLLLRSTGSRHVDFSSCGSRALERRLSSCGTQAQLLRNMWDLPGPGLEPVSPALAGGLSTTVPPGNPGL